MKKSFFTILLIIAFALFMGQAAFSQEDDETSENEFQSRELLVQTLLSGQPPEQEDQQRVQTFVDNLSDDQVFAFNRALNNAVKSQLYSEIIYDLDLLESLDVETLTVQDINFLTKALEEEAKFTKLHEKTGNDKFLTKAESQKEKFLDKAGIEIEEPDTEPEGEAVTTGEETVVADKGNTGNTATHTVGSSTNNLGPAANFSAMEAEHQAKMTAKQAEKAAKFAARDAKKASRAAAKEAKKEARSAAKEAKKEAKNAAKEAKKQSHQNRGKGKGHNK